MMSPVLYMLNELHHIKTKLRRRTIKYTQKFEKDSIKIKILAVNFNSICVADQSGTERNINCILSTSESLNQENFKKQISQDKLH